MQIDILEEAEDAIVGTILATSGQALDDIILNGNDFREPRRGDLFDLMRTMWGNQQPVDAFTLAEANPSQSAYLFSLTDKAVPSGSLPYYADVMRKHALRRRLSIAGMRLQSLDASMDSTAVAEAARASVEEAIGDPTQRVRYVRDILPSVVERMTAKDVFVPSPWPTLNAAIGGFRPGAVYVIAARPGVGKTVIAAQIAAKLAEAGHIAFASLEMTEDELVARLIAERLQINVGHIKDARMTPRDWQILADGRARLESLNIAVDDRSGVAASDVRAFARAVSKDGRLAGVVVDYMQLMVSKQRMDRHLQVADFSRQLKIMAKEMQIPVIALSQLNRNSEASSLAVPKLSDLRESGAIEQDADVVILLRREGEYPNEQIILDVAKNRHGETGEVPLSWDGGYSRAVEWNHTDGP